MTDEHATKPKDVEAPQSSIDEIREAAAGQAAAPKTADAKEAIDRATAAIGKGEGE